MKNYDKRLRSDIVDYRDLVAKASNLVSPPEVCERVTSLLDKPDVTVEEVAGVIGADPSLTGHLLQIANRQSKSENIDNPLDAVEIVGLEGVRSLMVATSANRAFSNIPENLVDTEDFWHHSVCCGLAAQALAGRCRQTRMVRPFFTGLLHDIGQLHIYEHMPEAAQRVLDKAGAPEEYRYKAEQEIIGFTHAQVGAELMRQWGLPAHLWEPVEFHHEPEKAKRYPTEAAIVHLATNIANVIEPSWKTQRGLEKAGRSINPRAWSLTGFGQDVIEPVVYEVMDDSIAVMEMISPDFLMTY